MNNKSIKIYLIGFVIWVILCVIAVFLIKQLLMVKQFSVMDYEGNRLHTEALNPFSHIDLRQLNTFVRDYDMDLIDDYEVVEHLDNWLEIISDTTVTEPAVTYPSGIEKVLDWTVSSDTLRIMLDVRDVKTRKIAWKMDKPVTIILPCGMVKSIGMSTPFPALSSLELKGQFGNNLKLESINSLSLNAFSVDTLTLSTGKVVFTGKQTVMDPFHESNNFIYENEIDINGAIIGGINVWLPDTADLHYNFFVSQKRVGRGRNQRMIGSIGKMNFLAAGCCDSTHVGMTYEGFLPDIIDVQSGVSSKIILYAEDEFQATGQTGERFQKIKTDK